MFAAAMFFVTDQLSDIYDPDESQMWFESPQLLLNNEVPAGMFQEGRGQEVLALVKQIRDCVNI